MKRRLKLRSRPYVKPVILGFLGIYLVAMGVIFHLQYEKYKEEIFKMVTNTGTSIEETLGDRKEWIEADLTQEKKNFLQLLASGMGTSTDDKYGQMSCAIYDKNGNLIVQSENVIGNYYLSEGGTKIDYFYYRVDDYLSKQEIEELARYRWANYQLGHEIDDIEELAPIYHIPIEIEESTKELAKISVLKAEWEDTKLSTEELAKLDHEDEHYWGPQKLVGEELVWEWKNPNVDLNAKTEYLTRYEMGILFPGLEYGLGHWREWQKMEWLHDFPQTSDIVGTANYRKYLLADPMDEEYLTLLVNFDTKPFLATLDAAKFIFLFSFLLVACCVITVFYFMEKAYKKQDALEEGRRDFTNAIAHELKTPLGVIRGFSENLAENTVEEKREYYLRQIIGQTEVMDDLVQEMIYISKLESDNLVLKKEELSFLNVIESQLKKLRPLVEEKNLTVDYKTQGDFTITGDKAYIEKAIWNLLANACEYNVNGGKIKITIGHAWCMIENNGNPIPEEDLKHLCEMFYSGDKSRTSGKKHMGLGLYLAKKILLLHKLNLTIANSDMGVRVFITR